jgi:hypothetical protein
LAKDRTGVSAAPINPERKPHSPVEAKRLAFSRPKAKGCGASSENGPTGTN